MRASDLSDEDIGREFLVSLPTGGPDRRRVTFEGFTRDPREMARADGAAFWLILKTSPTARGVLRFRTVSGEEFAGILVRSNAQVWPLEVEWAVTEDGSIVELGVKAA